MAKANLTFAEGQRVLVVSSDGEDMEEFVKSTKDQIGSTGVVELKSISSLGSQHLKDN